MVNENLQSFEQYIVNRCLLYFDGLRASEKSAPDHSEYILTADMIGILIDNNEKDTILFQHKFVEIPYYLSVRSVHMIWIADRHCIFIAS